MRYEVRCSARAEAAREALSVTRRTAFDRAVALPAADPFTPPSRPVGSADRRRAVLLTREMHMGYEVEDDGALLITSLTVHPDDTGVLVRDA